MKGGRQAGYTVVEVTLFLAISAMLFLVALIGTGSTIRTIRFSDSGRSVTAFVQRQYDEIINGLNTRLGNEVCSGGTVTTTGSQTPGTSDCLLMGKLLIFALNSPTITTYDVIGTEPAGVNYNQTDIQLINVFVPRVITAVGVENYEIPWGAKLTGGKRVSDNQFVTGLLLVRSPKSSRVVSFTYKPPATITPSLVDVDNASVVGNAANVGQVNNFCIKPEDGLGLPAKLEVTAAPTQSAVQIVFDADGSGSECNGT